MIPFLKRILKPFLDVRRGERAKAVLMFVYFMLVISTIYILKPVRNALFISDLGADKIKYINVAEGIFLVMVVSAYTWVSKRFSHRIFELIVNVFVILNLILFWIVSHYPSPAVSAVFFLWQATVSVVLTTQFWIFANDLFTHEQAKRLFGFIISGGSVGGVLGGWLTTVLMQVMPVHNLFLVVSVILGICIFLSTLLWKQARKGPVVPVEAFVPEHEPLHKKTGHLDVPAYLFLLGALVVIAKMTSTIVENQFAGVVEQTVTGKQAMAAFYGNFYAWLNLFSFLAQFILTAAFLRRFGTLGSIWMLPAGLAVLSVWNLCAVSLVAAVVYRMYDGTMNYSVQQASKEILYLPLSSKTRRQVKPWIDMLGFRGAKTLAGLFMIAGTLLFHLPTTGMGYLVLALIPWWMLVLVLLRKKIQPVVKL